MTMWEDLMNCICQNGPQRPGMQELLSTLERHTVCTGTQCFEGESEAFGLTTTGNQAPTDNTMFFMMMMCADARAAAATCGRRRERRSAPPLPRAFPLRRRRRALAGPLPRLPSPPPQVHDDTAFFADEGPQSLQTRLVDSHSNEPPQPPPPGISEHEVHSLANVDRPSPCSPSEPKTLGERCAQSMMYEKIRARDYAGRPGRLKPRKAT